MEAQLALQLAPRTWGGKRPGAGRKTNKSKGIPSHDPPHASREGHVRRNPLHVVLRTVMGAGSLRRASVYAAVNGALQKVAARAEFRVVHISIQRTHLHLLVEAESKIALESGMRALAISLARRINRALDRRGRLFAFRYHTTALTTPTQVRNAIAYVLNNWRRHREDERNSVEERFWKLDKFSSAIRFTGWSDWTLTAWPTDYIALPVSSPQTWLLSGGWRKSNRPIRTSDTPGPID